MSYFGGIGAGKGWHAFKFVITPNEFIGLLSEIDFYFVIANSGVELDYKFTEKYPIFQAYKNYYNKIISGEEWKRKFDHSLDIRISIIDDLNKIKSEKIGSDYKRLKPSEPVINISPFFLHFKNEKMSVQLFHEPGHLGLELSYPKVISWDYEKHEILHDTSNFPVKVLYNKLVRNIEKITKKTKIQGPNKLYKPNFWISENAVKEINNNHFLKENNLILK